MVAEQVPASTQPAVKVLIVEDEPVFAARLEMTLRSEARTETAATLAEAVARLRSGVFDAVLLDLDLDDSAGLATVEALVAVTDLPVVVMTATADEAMGRQAVKLGAQDYLIKGQDNGRHIRRALHYAIERRQSERERRASEQRFRDYAEVAADWFWETDAGGYFIWISERFRDIVGLDPDSLVGSKRTDFMRIPPDDPALELYHRTLERREVLRNFVYSFAAGESERHFRISGKPVHSPDGVFMGYRGVGSDITAEVEAQNFALRMLATLMDALNAVPEALMVLDAEGTLLIANEGASLLLPECADILVPGRPFAHLLLAGTERGLFQATDGPLDRWLEECRQAAAPAPRSRVAAVRDGSECLCLNYYPTPSGGALMILHPAAPDASRPEGL